jgi:hypothetical protein
MKFQRKDFAYILVMVILGGVLVYYISKGPLFIMELFFPKHIVLVNPENIEALIIAHGQSLDAITQLLLKGESVNPCLLAKFLEQDALLVDQFTSCLVENGFLTSKTQ